ncbi:MAG: hypothetical protein JO288_05200 [Hyphomicrobiales bacterium]|nr:hypothetical protein [Hyphomicrobiales bacterium]
MFRKSLLLTAALLAGTSLGALAGTVTPLTNGVPFDGVIYGFLLTDGSILFQGGNLQDFYRFKPDSKGSYVNGTYSLAASLPPDYVPYATSGGVLPDGRLLLIGGEYLLTGQPIVVFKTLVFAFTNKMAIYDPNADTWTMIAPPFNTAGDWDFIGDSPWTMLKNGHLLLGQKFSTAMAELDPKTLRWTNVSSFAKDDIFAEEGLTLLPDGTVLTVNMTDFNFAQRFIPNSDPSKTRWADAGATPKRLPATDSNSAQNIVYDNGMRVYHPPGEIGPGMLRPDGTVFYTGAACDVPGPPTKPDACVTYQPQAYTAIYDPKTNSWKAGPDIPTHEGAGDTWASLLPDGNVFMQTNPPGTNQDRLKLANARRAGIVTGKLRPLAAAKEAAPGGFLPQQSCPPGFPLYKAYEFNGTSLIHEGVADFCGQPDLLLLPTGGVMMNGQVVYNGSGTFLNTWRPTITSFLYSNFVTPGGTYQIFGTQFNGLSQANAFGDEFQVFTNFPLVRITNNATGDVSYATTHDFSTMGVATGSAIVSTWFDVPTDLEIGASKLEVVANGIPSVPLPITVVMGGAFARK